MFKLPGDPAVSKMFGFPGFEATLRVLLKYVNLLRNEQGMPELTYEQWRLEIEEKMQEILADDNP